MAHPAVNIWMNGIYTDLYGFLWINMDFFMNLFGFTVCMYKCVYIYIYHMDLCGFTLIMYYL